MRAAATYGGRGHRKCIKWARCEAVLSKEVVTWKGNHIFMTHTPCGPNEAPAPAAMGSTGHQSATSESVHPFFFTQEVI